ncbi:carbohydrate-binding module family 20 domain-containing protein, partial [Nonomuraea angiospora]
DRGWIGINDSSSAATAEFATGLADGHYCDVISGALTGSGCTGTTVAVAGGRATVTIPAGGAVAIHANAKATTGTVKVATTFTVTATPAGGQDLYVVGSDPALGSWAPAGAVRLTAKGDNVFSGIAELPRSTAVEYKYLKKTSAGTVTWESGANRTLTTPAAGTHAVTDVFRGDTVSSQIATSFNATVSTSYGQNVYVVGNVAALGGWSPAAAVPLSSADYPIWRATVNLPPGTSVEYKYLKKNPDGSVTWESGGNRTFTTPSTGTHTRNDTWK